LLVTIYQTLFDSPLLGTFVTDGNGGIRDANRVGAAILGLPSPHDLLGRNIQDFYRDPADRRLPELIGKNETLNLEIEMSREDGTHVTTLLSATPLTLNRKRVILISLLDITAPKPAKTAPGKSRKAGNTAPSPAPVSGGELPAARLPSVNHPDTGTAPERKHDAVHALAMGAVLDKVTTSITEKKFAMEDMHGMDAPFREALSRLQVSQIQLMQDAKFAAVSMRAELFKGRDNGAEVRECARVIKARTDRTVAVIDHLHSFAHRRDP